MVTTTRFTSLNQAYDTVGGLSKPGKMPTHGWSIPASRCNVGCKLAHQAGSAGFGCYANKGRYGFPNVQNAMERRYQRWKKNRKRWVDAMCYIMENNKVIQETKVFRWFDSGDLQGEVMLDDINEIAWRSGDVRFWLPTKEYGVVKNYSKEVAPNLNIRISHPKLNSSYPSNVFVDYTNSSIYDYTNSSIYKKDRLGEVPSGAKVCPATVPGNPRKCGDCRNCWDKDVKEVVYIYH